LRWALYLFLACVADARGLSYYAEATLSRRLRLPATRLAQARRDLIALDLIAYDPPLYQVLSLPETVPRAVHLERLRTSLEGRHDRLCHLVCDSRRRRETSHPLAAGRQLGLDVRRCATGSTDRIPAARGFSVPANSIRSKAASSAGSMPIR